VHRKLGVRPRQLGASGQIGHPKSLNVVRDMVCKPLHVRNDLYSIPVPYSGFNIAPRVNLSGGNCFPQAQQKILS
jgi:hypothetical protein